MRSYPLYIDGRDVEGTGWTYVVRASALIRAPEAMFNLKRQLELGTEGVEATEDVVGRCAVGVDEHNEAALEAARRASVEFGRFPLERRRQILLDLWDATVARAGEFVELLIAEGHPRRLAEWEVSGVLRGGDPATVDWYCDQFAREFRHEGKRLDLVRKPDGVVCVNPPQNAAGSNGAMGSLAVLAGNAIVVKAPRSTPLSVMFFYRDLMAPLLEQHGAPPGTLNLISGDTQRILRRWLTSPLVDDLLFFGDSTTGLRIGAEAVANGKKPILELAGNDGFVVWSDADLDAAAEALTESFYGSSQICMVPKYAIVHPDVAERFLEAFLAKVERIRPGFPENRETVLSPVLKGDRFFDFLAEAREAGCPVLSGGERVDVHGEPSALGPFFQPTVVRVDGLESARELSCVREETFFPLLSVVVPEQRNGDDDLLERVIEFVNANEYGLRNSVWSRSDAVARRFARAVTNGGLLKVNDSHIGFVSYLSTHGGTGRTGGPYGELNYVGLRTTHMQGIVWGNGEASPLDGALVAASATA